MDYEAGVAQVYNSCRIKPQQLSHQPTKAVASNHNTCRINPKHLSYQTTTGFTANQHRFADIPPPPLVQWTTKQELPKPTTVVASNHNSCRIKPQQLSHQTTTVVASTHNSCRKQTYTVGSSVYQSTRPRSVYAEVMYVTLPFGCVFGDAGF